MKVLSILGPRSLIMEDLPVPELTSGNAIVKMEMCGICGSDLTAYAGKNPTMKYPVHGIGHEGVGVITEIGVNDKNLKPGDRVALEPYVPDFTCHMCKAGRYNNCTDIHVCGVHKNGMMAEYFSHPISLIHKLPDSLDMTRAALVEPLTIGLHGATRVKASKGEKVVIIGAGTIGLMAAFACRSYGAVPILIDVVQERLDFAQNQLGMPHTFNSRNGGVVPFLKALTGGKMPEAMIDCTGVPAILAEMHDYVCYGGRIALVGWPHAPVTINTIRCMQKELDIYTSRNSCGKFPEAIWIMTEAKLPVDRLITKVIDFQDCEATFIDMMEKPGEYLKVIAAI